jgi:hypothetical protein
MVDVDVVYKTVLYILNKEQRGYMTPDEFNRLGTQVQLEIFEQYFEELNQQLRVPENDSEYANRVKNLDEKIDIFKTTGATTYDNVTTPLTPYFYGPSDVHKVGTVIYNGIKELQRIQRNDFLLINKSPLTKPTLEYPVYIQEGEHQSVAIPLTLHPIVYVYPDTIQTAADITLTYIKKPSSPVWNYSTLANGAYQYTATGSTQFELDGSEQVNIILNILMYSGVIIRDPQVVQTAAQLVQQDTVNEKT